MGYAALRVNLAITILRGVGLRFIGVLEGIGCVGNSCKWHEVAGAHGKVVEERVECFENVADEELNKWYVFRFRGRV